MPNSTPSQTHHISIADLLVSFSAQHPTTIQQTTAGEPTNNSSPTPGSQNTSSLIFNQPFTTLIEEFPALKEHIIEVAHVGSTFICSPTPTDTDIDNLVLLKGKLYHKKRDIFNILQEAGWDGNEEYFTNSSEFHSFKKDNLNLIFTFDPNFYSKFLLAAEVCQNLNLHSKHDRIMIHDAIISGISPGSFVSGILFNSHENSPHF